MKELGPKGNIIKRVLIVVLVLIAIILILLKAQDFMKEKTDDSISLIINNTNVTQRLKYDVKIENNNIYVSMDDIKNFFDKYIYIEDEINEIVTTYNDKIASIGFEANKLTLNGSTKKINAHAIKENDVVYIPISEMTDVYNIEINNIESTKVITIDSLEREQLKVLQREINNLTKQQREVLYLKYYKKMSSDEIAQVMGLTSRTVYNTTHTAISRLREQLSKTFLLAVGANLWIFN